VCCFAWNLDKLATEAEKAQPVLSNIIGAMCLYMCLAEQHQMAFDMVLSQGHGLLHTADSQLNHFYVLYLYTHARALCLLSIRVICMKNKTFFHLPHLIFLFHVNKPLIKNHDIFPQIVSLS